MRKILIAAAALSAVATPALAQVNTSGGLVNVSVQNVDILKNFLNNDQIAALNNVTLPFVLALADKGYRRALGEDPHLRAGLNVYEGKVTHRAVAEALKLKFTPPEAALRL